MARGLNHAHLVGTLVQPPDLRYTPAGLAVLHLDLAGDDHVTGDDGEVRQLAWYHRVTLFGTRAEGVAEAFDVGTALLVDGHVEQRSWQTDDGERRSAVDVIADRVEALELGPRGDAPTVEDARGQPRLRDAGNRIRLIGNLTRDAEARVTASGHALTRFGVAINERVRSRGNGEVERTHFVEVQAWRALAEASGTLAKGAGVYVEGRLVTDRWEDEDGRRRFATRLEAQRIEQLARPGANRAHEAAPPEAAVDGAAQEEVPF